MVLHDTEDKNWWTKYGEKLENLFLQNIAPEIGPNAQINPDKNTNRYAPDFIINGSLAELKTQNTPFFTASRYGKDPGRTVTFNKKDYIRYLELYPKLPIYFYVRWDTLNWKDLKVNPLHGVWMTEVKEVTNLITAKKAPLHEYQRRVDDHKGNARDSFLLSLDDLHEVALLPNPK